MLEFISDLWACTRERKKFWMALSILTTSILGGLIVLAQSSTLAPFIHTLF